MDMVRWFGVGPNSEQLQQAADIEHVNQSMPHGHHPDLECSGAWAALRSSSEIRAEIRMPADVLRHRCYQGEGRGYNRLRFAVLVAIGTKGASSLYLAGSAAFWDSNPERQSKESGPLLPPSTPKGVAQFCQLWLPFISLYSFDWIVL